MQSMHQYGLHTIRATDIIQHLQTQKIAEQIPDFLSGLLQNPFNYSSGIMSMGCIAFAIYLFVRCLKQPVQQLSQPSAPPAPVQFIYPHQMSKL